MHEIEMPAPGIKIWAGYLFMCLGMFMAILDIQIVASSLPDIQFALGIPKEDLSWIQTSYLIAEIIAIPLTGWLTGLLSLGRLFMIATLAFTLASFGCAMSESFAMLLGFRIVQGFFGGLLIPVVFTSVFTLFPPKNQVLATTIGGLFAMLAPTIGPVMGGYITENTSWHWLFLINIIPGIMVTIAIAFLIPRKKPQWKLLTQLDTLALIMIALCLGSLELGLKSAPAEHWVGGKTALYGSVFLIAGFIAIRRCLRRPFPIIDLRCFADRNFSISCFYSFVLGMGLYGSVYLVPLFLAFVRQHTPFEIGKIMIVMGVAQLIMAPIAAIAEKRLPQKLLIALGFALFASGLLSNSGMNFESDYQAHFWPQIGRGAAVLLCLLPITSMALEHLPAHAVANASGVFNLMRNLGGAIALALIDTVLEQRAPSHAANIISRLQAGNPQTAAFVGLPVEKFQNLPMPPVDEATRHIIAPLIERAALVQAFNDAWLMLGAVFLASLLLLPFLKKAPR